MPAKTDNAFLRAMRNDTGFLPRLESLDPRGLSPEGRQDAVLGRTDVNDPDMVAKPRGEGCLAWLFGRRGGIER